MAIRLGSDELSGNVWLRGLVELPSADEPRDWLVGVNGLSVTKVDVGLVSPAEKEHVVSSDVVLLVCVC